MKKILFTLTVMLALSSGILLYSQDIQANLDAARSSYQSGDLENARFSLQEALNMINQAIGQEILGMLPASVGGMAKTQEIMLPGPEWVLPDCMSTVPIQVKIKMHP
jgi:hypothetical protein